MNLKRFFDHLHRTRHPRINEDTGAPYFVMTSDGNVQAYRRGDEAAQRSHPDYPRYVDIEYPDDGNHGDV